MDVPGIQAAFAISTAAGIGAIFAFVENLWRTSNASSVVDGVAGLVAAAVFAALASFGVTLVDGFQYTDVVAAVVAAVQAFSPATAKVQGPNAT